MNQISIPWVWKVRPHGRRNDISYIQLIKNTSWESNVISFATSTMDTRTRQANPISCPLRTHILVELVLWMYEEDDDNNHENNAISNDDNYEGTKTR